MDNVVVGALVRQGSVLLAHRSPDKQAYPGVWELPGGVVEPGEQEADALVRELAEELGVEADASEVTLLARVMGGPPDGPAAISAWLVPRWRGVPWNRAPDEHQAVGWFDVGALPRLAHARVEEALLRALRSPPTP